MTTPPLPAAAGAPDPRRPLAITIRVGTLLAGACLAIGALWLWFQSLRTPTPAPRDVPLRDSAASPDVAADLALGPASARFWIVVGMLLLILTPAARALVGAGWFAFRRERTLALAGAAVALVLLSLALGLLR